MMKKMIGALMVLGGLILAGSAKAENIALQATSTASSYLSEGGVDYAPGRVNDNDLSYPGGAWVSADTTMPQWIVLEWTSAVSISQVKVSHIGSASTFDQYNTVDYEIQVWIDGAWQVADSITGNTQGITTSRFSTPYLTNKLRVYITKATQDSADGIARIVEIAVFPPVTLQKNIASQASVTASSLLASEYHPNKIKDNDMSYPAGAWISAEVAEPHWVVLEWDDVIPISMVKLFHIGSVMSGVDQYNTVDFEIQVWVDGFWQTVESVTGNTAGITTSKFSAPYTTNKLRVYVTKATQDSGDGLARIVEVQIAPPVTLQENIAPYAYTTASSTLIPAYNSDKVNDNDFTYPGWVSAETTEPHWIELEWPNEVSVSLVKVYHAGYAGSIYESLNTSDFAVQLWLNGGWQTVGSRTTNTNDVSTVKLGATYQTQKLRLYVSKATQTNDTLARILEIKVIPYSTLATQNGTFEVPSVASITCDGNLSDWTSSTEWSLPYILWSGIGLTSTTQAKFAWNDSRDMLYVAVKTNETSVIAKPGGHLVIGLSKNIEGVPYPSSADATQLCFDYNTTKLGNVWIQNEIATYGGTGGIQGVEAGCLYDATTGNYIYEVAIPFWDNWTAPQNKLTLSAGEAIYLYSCMESEWGSAIGTNLTYYENPQFSEGAFEKAAELTFVAGPMIPGDANHDMMVDVGDLGILAANYGRNLRVDGLAQTEWWSKGDFNDDGLVDVGDLGILAAHYGEGVNASLDFSADYAKAFGTTVEDDAAETGSSICTGLGLPLILGVFLACLLLGLTKQEA
jgi:hypothetical protein